jgi:hypothetical protein
MQSSTNQWTKPERPVQIYSYWGSPADNVGEDGDFVFEEMSSSLIGPKENGKWPEDLRRIEGPVLGKHGCFPRWRSRKERTGKRERRILGRLRRLLRFFLIGDDLRLFHFFNRPPANRQRNGPEDSESAVEQPPTKRDAAKGSGY